MIVYLDKYLNTKVNTFFIFPNFIFGKKFQTKYLSEVGKAHNKVMLQIGSEV